MRWCISQEWVLLLYIFLLFTISLMIAQVWNKVTLEEWVFVELAFNMQRYSVKNTLHHTAVFANLIVFCYFFQFSIHDVLMMLDEVTKKSRKIGNLLFVNVPFDYFKQGLSFANNATQNSCFPWFVFSIYAQLSPLFFRSFVTSIPIYYKWYPEENP